MITYDATLKGHRAPFVDQTILYDPADGVEKGNCTEAAVASILGLNLDEVPDFRGNGLEQFWPTFHKFFRARGFEALLMPGNFRPEVLYLASGVSPRGAHHMVVMQDGEIIHDPHPSRAGIGEPAHTWLVVPTDPARRGGA